MVIPEQCLLNPSPEAAVVGGNVLTSQRVTDVVLKAFGAAAASQVRLEAPCVTAGSVGLRISTLQTPSWCVLAGFALAVLGSDVPTCNGMQRDMGHRLLLRRRSSSGGMQPGPVQLTAGILFLLTCRAV